MSNGKYSAKKGMGSSPKPGFALYFLLAILGLLLLGILLGILFLDPFGARTAPAGTTGEPIPGMTQGPQVSTPPPTTEPKPTEPYVTATASVGVTGDIMGHMPVVNTCKTADGYDFSGIFTYVKDYYARYDFMVANLEVNLGGPEAGRYQGYPLFNCPDEIASDLYDAGVDMVLTANNHSYDMGHKPFFRTQEILDTVGLQHLGTRTEATAPNYMVQDINGIQVGMVCYTYETGNPSDSRKALNGIPMSAEDSQLIGSFNYKDLPGFYEEVKADMDGMKAAGAEVTMVYIHWGDEYALKPNTNQTAIAQQLCELGVDVIVGGHPHVVEPFNTLTSSTGHQTYCVYSVGNAISNQRRDTLANTTKNAIYTEDGMIFGVVFEKWNDGTVKVREISILPTWVNKETKNGKVTYSIIPLDISLDAWDGFDVGNTQNLYTSYERTMSIVGEGLNACRQALGLEAAPMTKEAN